MADHRIRLSDDDLSLIVSALRARMAMAGPLRAHRIERLAARLAEGGRGNPRWRLGDFEQTHENELDADDVDGGKERTRSCTEGRRAFCSGR